MVDTKALFDAAWAEEVENRRKQSPSFNLADYTVTGRASAQYGGKRNADWWADNGPKLVQNWIDWRLKTRWALWETPEGNPGIELELNINLPGDIPVKMFIDRVFVTPVGELAIVDLKTGRSPETPEQLGLYATGIELTWGQQYRPTWGFWWDANKGEHSQPMDLTMFTPSYFAALYRQAIAGINAQAFLPQPANNCKAWCGVAEYCAAVKGPKAAGVDPLLSD